MISIAMSKGSQLVGKFKLLHQQLVLTSSSVRGSKFFSQWFVHVRGIALYFYNISVRTYWQWASENNKTQNQMFICFNLNRLTWIPNHSVGLHFFLKHKANPSISNNLASYKVKRILSTLSRIEGPYVFIGFDCSALSRGSLFCLSVACSFPFQDRHLNNI